MCARARSAVAAPHVARPTSSPAYWRGERLAGLREVLLDLGPDLGLRHLLRPVLRGLELERHRDVAVERGQVEVEERPDKLGLGDDPVPERRVHVDVRDVGDDLVGPEDAAVVVVPGTGVELEVVRAEGELRDVGEVGPGARAERDVRALVPHHERVPLVRPEQVEGVVGRVDAEDRGLLGVPEGVRGRVVGVGLLEAVAAGGHEQRRRQPADGREVSDACNHWRRVVP